MSFMNLLFDFDGTISDSLDTFLKVINPSLIKLGKKKLTRKEVRQKGPLKLLKENNINPAYVPLLMLYARHKFTPLIPNLKTFPNMKGVVVKLSENHNLGIVTSNSTSNVNQFLANNKLSEHFKFVYSSMNFFNKGTRIENAIAKNKYKNQDTYFIGDETRDISSAKKVGIKTVAVTWGMENEKLLAKSKPTKIARMSTDLLKIFS